MDLSCLVNDCSKQLVTVVVCILVTITVYCKCFERESNLLVLFNGTDRRWFVLTLHCRSVPWWYRMQERDVGHSSAKFTIKSK